MGTVSIVDFFRAVGRRWYVLVAGILLTAVAGLLALQTNGVYTARTAVTLMAPVGWAVGGNTLNDSATSLVGFAKIVEETMSDGKGGQLFAAPGTRLYGAGVREAELVFVPNYGGQWAPNFNQPAIVIDVVGPTAVGVQERVIALTEEIGATAEALQDKMGVTEDQRVTWIASPATPVVEYVGINRMRALAGIAVMGGGLSLFATAVADKLLNRRQLRRARASVAASASLSPAAPSAL